MLHKLLEAKAIWTHKSYQMFWPPKDSRALIAVDVALVAIVAVDVAIVVVIVDVVDIIVILRLLVVLTSNLFVTKFKLLINLCCCLWCSH